jgi:hypothetical protein
MPPASTGSPEWRRTIATTLRRVIPGLGTPRRPDGGCRACPSSLAYLVRAHRPGRSARRRVDHGASGCVNRTLWAGGGGIPGTGYAGFGPARCSRSAVVNDSSQQARLSPNGSIWTRVFTCHRHPLLARAVDLGLSSTTVSGSNDDESHPCLRSWQRSLPTRDCLQPVFLERRYNGSDWK